VRHSVEFAQCRNSTQVASILTSSRPRRSSAAVSRQRFASTDPAFGNYHIALPETTDFLKADL
jgi:hypothetical protein